MEWRKAGEPCFARAIPAEPGPPGGDLQGAWRRVCGRHGNHGAFAEL